MALVLFLGGVLGWFIYRASAQREAVAAIRQAGGSVIYNWQWKDGSIDSSAQPAVPEWLLDRLDPICSIRSSGSTSSAAGGRGLTTT